MSRLKELFEKVRNLKPEDSGCDGLIMFCDPKDIDSPLMKFLMQRRREEWQKSQEHTELTSSSQNVAGVKDRRGEVF